MTAITIRSCPSPLPRETRFRDGRETVLCHGASCCYLWLDFWVDLMGAINIQSLMRHLLRMSGNSCLWPTSLMSWRVICVLSDAGTTGHTNQKEPQARVPLHICCEVSPQTLRKGLKRNPFEGEKSSDQSLTLNTLGMYINLSSLFVLASFASSM